MTVYIRYTNRLRMPLDILMTLLSVILMGGTVLFPDDRVHQIYIEEYALAMGAPCRPQAKPRTVSDSEGRT